jgi:alpha/beta superfamily hydrolase
LNRSEEVIIILSTDELTLNTEEVWVECEDAKLYGVLYIPKNVPAPGLLICHGMNAQGFHLLTIYKQLARTACKNGFVSFVFDFRGVGKSVGKFDYGWAEQKDITCALNYLASRPEVLSNNVYVVGHSLGGVVSLYALQNEARVKGLVLWSTPKNHDYNVRKFIKRTKGAFGLYSFLLLSRVDKVINVSRLFRLRVYGINLRLKDVREKLMKLDACKAASNLSIPLFVVVGDQDVIVGVDEAKEIFASAHRPKNLLILRGADHVFKGREVEVIAKTIGWIKRVEGEVSTSLQKG